jgi:hypothetical protein
VLIGTRSVNGPAPDGGPSPFRVLKTHVALLAIPVVVLFPAAALLIPRTTMHSPLLRWLAAVRKPETNGPEIFTRVCAPAGV